MPNTQITLSTGDSVTVEGDHNALVQNIHDTQRSPGEANLVFFGEFAMNQAVGINPDHIVLTRLLAE